MSFRQWFALLVVGAAVLVGLGVGQLAGGNTAPGVALIVIAIADVVFVAAVRRFGRRRPTR
jgi:membrane protein implicated in regulation of membrane protease activity